MMTPNFFKNKFLIVLVCMACACQDGAEGIEGKQSLMDFVAEPIGPNCATGGYKVLSGVDENRNDVLDENEVQTTKYLCNGNSNGFSSLIDLVIEPAGTNCAFGGYKVVSGVDVNQDKVLQAAEVLTSKYICSGGTGANTLFDFYPEPIGQNCASGGFKTSNGVDMNRNGVLDESEIRETVYLCNGATNIDKTLRIPFPSDGYGTNSLTGEIYPTNVIRDFDIRDYTDVESITFGAYLSGEGSGMAELYDVTSDAPIADAQITSTSGTLKWHQTTVNFIDNLPKKPVTLGVRIRSNQAEKSCGYYLALITIRRK